MIVFTVQAFCEVDVATVFRAGPFGVRMPVRGKSFLLKNDQAGSRVYPCSCSMGTGFLSWG